MPRRLDAFAFAPFDLLRASNNVTASTGYPIGIDEGSAHVDSDWISGEMPLILIYSLGIVIPSGVEYAAGRRDQRCNATLQTIKQHISLPFCGTFPHPLSHLPSQPIPAQTHLTPPLHFTPHHTTPHYTRSEDLTSQHCTSGAKTTSCSTGTFRLGRAMV